MENKPLISILIPTYNRPKYLKECLSSILEQKGFSNNELEFIISDNSKNNESHNVIKYFIINNINKNIIYNKNKKNLGFIGNINKLLTLKQGKYFIFLSDDDKFYNNYSLINLYNGLIKYKLDACYGFINIENKKTKRLKSHINKLKNKDIYYDYFKFQIIGDYHSIGFGGVLYKNYNYKYNTYAGDYTDRDFNLRYLLKNKKIGLINKDTFKYRIHDNQISNNISIFKDLILYINILYNLKINKLLMILYVSKFILKRTLPRLIIKLLYIIHLYSYIRYTYIKISNIINKILLK